MTLAPGSSLIRGGPWSAAAEVLGLMRKDGSPVSVRIVILVAVLWVPLVLLAYAQSGADMAFRVLQDFVVWSRLLVAVPLLLFSEPVVDRRVTIALETIRREGLVGPDSLEAWNEGLRKAHRFASGIVPLLSIAIVSIAMVASHFNTPLQATSVDWMHVSGGSLSWAGLWYTALGRPFYLFLLLLWIWRWASISLLLIRVSRLPLRLMVSHPDRVGGLGVLGEVPPSASGVIVAMGAVVAAQFAWEMMSQGTSLRSLAPAIGAFAAATLIFTVGPLFFLTPQLLQLQRKALVQFGILAARHSSRFEGRWMEEKGTGTEGKDEEIVGAPDFSSLIDLGSSYEVARSIRTMPFRPSIVKGILAAALIPMIPLVFMEFQLEEILTRLAKIIL